MKRYLQRARETLNELNEGMKVVHLAIFEKRAQGLERAVNEGWFKHFLIGTGLVGAGLVYAGLTNDNDSAAHIGYGMFAMDGLYALGCYGLPALRRFRNRHQDTQE